MSKLLNQISSPQDLRKFTNAELEELATEIRSFIVDQVEANGGHLGSNLGIVELTIALHKVLNSPEDVLLFDTGHQAYVHKILTGRISEFDTLRKANGLSGYPSRSESDHDWIENSHASTSLSYAHGLSEARKQSGEPGRIIAIIGDGSMTGGMAFEGLNNLGHSGSKVTIIYNDNGRSYAPTVSLLSQSLTKIRSNPTYVRRQKSLESFVRKIPVFGPWWYSSIRSSKAAVREFTQQNSFFEQLGVRYLGPFDGHNLSELEDIIEKSAEFDGPTVLHVITQKGRGYAPAENDKIKNMHDLGAVKPGSYTEAFSNSIVDLATKHDEVVAITAAMPDSTGLLPFIEKFPKRALDVGIAEQHAVTAAAGMAMGGLRPVIALYSTFLTRAFDQVNLDVGLHKLPVIFCLDRAGVTGDDGPSHHGILDLVLLSKVPGMTIFCPSSYEEIPQMLSDAYKITSGPVAIRWPKTAAARSDVIGTGTKARQVSSGTEVCLIGVGKMLQVAESAAEILEREGTSCSVWDPRVVKPFDPELLSAAECHKLVVSIEDGLVVGGVGSCLRKELRVDVPMVNLGLPTEHIEHSKPEDILTRYGLDAESVAKVCQSNLP